MFPGTKNEMPRIKNNFLTDRAIGCNKFIFVMFVLLSSVITFIKSWLGYRIKSLLLSRVFISIFIIVNFAGVF